MRKLRRSHLIATALAVLAAVLQPAPSPPDLFADHDKSNPGIGYEWRSAEASVITTDDYWHDNYWICHKKATTRIVWLHGGRQQSQRVEGCTGAIGRASATDDHQPETSRACHARGTDQGDAQTNGCNNGHAPSGGWTFLRHSTRGKVAGTTQHHCPVLNKNVTAPSHCGTWVELCPAGSDPAVEHRHTGSAPASTTGWHLACSPAHELCRPGASNTVTVSAKPGGHHTARQMPGCDEPAPAPVECATGQHKHGTDPCHADHTPQCIPGLSSDQTQNWTPTPNHGHDPVRVPGCDPPPVLDSCSDDQHRHAAAVPGGHGSCRAAHAAPNCTWNTAGTWSPGHGGAASDGHTTTTGMRVCVSVRAFCVDQGAYNALAETADRQRRNGISPDDRGLFGDGYDRDRIPYPPAAPDIRPGRHGAGLTIRGKTAIQRGPPWPSTPARSSPSASVGSAP